MADSWGEALELWKLLGSDLGEVFAVDDLDADIHDGDEQALVDEMMAQLPSGKLDVGGGSTFEFDRTGMTQLAEELTRHLLAQGQLVADAANDAAHDSLKQRAIDEDAGPLYVATIEDGSIIVRPGNLFGRLDDAHCDTLAHIAVSMPGLDLIPVDGSQPAYHVLRWG